MPAGRVAVVRDLLSFAGGSSGDLSIAFESPGGAVISAIRLTTPAGLSAHWEGRQVLNAGEIIVISGPAASFLMISGYELTA